MEWISIIAGSTVIAALIAFFTTQRQEKNKNIVGERAQWREEIRALSEKIQGAKPSELGELLEQLKLRINSYGMPVYKKGAEEARKALCEPLEATTEKKGKDKRKKKESKEKSVKSKKYIGMEPYYKDTSDVDVLSDGHIWQLIDEMEGHLGSFEYAKLKEEKKLLNQYLSALLKYDWERSKSEIKGIPEFGIMMLVLAVAICLDFLIYYVIAPKFYAEFILFSVAFYLFFIFACIFDIKFTDTYDKLDVGGAPYSHLQIKKTLGFDLLARALGIVLVFAALYTMFIFLRVGSIADKNGLSIGTGGMPYTRLFTMPYDEFTEISAGNIPAKYIQYLKSPSGITPKAVKAIQPTSNTTSQPVYMICILWLLMKMFAIASSMTLENYIRSRQKFQQDSYIRLVASLYAEHKRKKLNLCKSSATGEGDKEKPEAGG